MALNAGDLLTAALKDDNAKVLDFLLTNGCAVNTLCGWNDNAAPVLLYALDGRKQACVELLLNNYVAEIDFSKKHKRWGQTALHIICQRYDNPEFVKTAIKYGSQVDAAEKGGLELIPFIYACQNSNSQMALAYRDSVKEFDCVVKKPKDFYAEVDYMFNTACQQGNLNLVDALLNEGMDVNYQTADGFTGLMWACKNNKKDIVERILKESNVDFELKNKYRETALSYAKQLYDLNNREIYENLQAYQEHNALMKSVVDPDSESRENFSF